MTISNITTHFNKFLNNPAIKQLSKIPKWSISDVNKRPISLYSLFNRGEIRGAMFNNPLDTMSIDDMIRNFCEKFPDAGMIANFAFYLDVMTDDFCVLDIEPSCPYATQKELLSLPYAYAETSMSGRGFHLIFPKPANFNDFPAATQKIVLKQNKGHYEILLNHWVTFTGLPLRRITNNATQDQSAFEALYADLASQVKASVEPTIEINKENLNQELSDIPDADFLIETLTNEMNTPNISPSQYNNDMSRYEFAFIGIQCNQLNKLLKNSTIIKNNHAYTPEEKSLILYAIATEQLPYRDKHDTKRNGLPWLLYEATQIVALRETEK